MAEAEMNQQALALLQQALAPFRQAVESRLAELSSAVAAYREESKKAAGELQGKIADLTGQLEQDSGSDSSEPVSEHGLCDAADCETCVPLVTGIFRKGMEQGKADIMNLPGVKEAVESHEFLSRPILIASDGSLKMG